MATGRFGIWISRIALLGLALIVALALAVLAVDLGWQRERIAGYALEIARERLGVPVEIDAVSGRFHRGIALENVRIGASKAPLFEAERIGFRWSLQSILHAARGQEWVAQQVQISGARLSLHRNADGKWGEVEALLERLTETSSPEAASGPSLRIRRIVVDRFRISVQLDPDPRWPEPRAPWRAEWATRGRVRDLRVAPDRPVSIERMEVDGSLARAVENGPFSLERADLELVLEEQRLRRARVSANGPGLRIEAHATGRLDALDPLTLSFEADRIDAIAPWIAPWLQAPSPPKGRLKLAATLRGPPRALVGRVDLEGHALQDGARRIETLELAVDFDTPLFPLPDDLFELSAGISVDARGVVLADLAPPGWPVAPLELRARGEVREGRILVEEGAVQTAGLSMRGQARLDRRRIEAAEAAFEIEQLARFEGLLGRELAVAGKARGTLALRGPLRAPSGVLAVRADDVTLDDRALGAFDLRAVRQAKEAAGPNSSPAPIDLELTWTEAGRPLAEGRAEIRADWAGGTFSLRTQPGAARVFSVPPPLENARATLHGGIEGRGKGVRIDLAALDAATEHVRLGLEAPASITAAPEGAWALSAPRIRLAPVDSSATEADAEVSASAPARNAPAGAASGQIGFEARGRGTNADRIEIEIEALPAELWRFAWPEAPIQGGHLSGRAGLSLSREAKAPTRGELRWLEPEIAALRFERLDLRFEEVGRTIEARAALQLRDTRPLEAKATLALEEAGLPTDLKALFDRTSLEIELDRFDLTALMPLVPVSPRWLRQPTGVVSGRLTVPRGARQGAWRGELVFEDGGATLPLLGQRFSPIEGRLVLDARALRIESLGVGRPGRGAFFTGDVDLTTQGEMPLKGTLRLEDFPFARTRLANTDVDGEIRVGGTLEAPIVRGELRLDETWLRVPEADDPVLREIRIVRGEGNGGLVEPAERRPGPLDRSDIEVTLLVPESTRIRGQGVQLFVEGKVTVKRLPGEALRLRGETNVVNGSYVFQGRRFRVRRGRVRLVGETRIDPVLDIEAGLPIRDIVAIIEVTGRLSEPVVRLRSEPERSEQDVLAYLLFGRPASEVGIAQEGRFNATAARLVAGVAERELRNLLGDAMPIDSIEIGADAEGNTSELGFGKFIGPDIFIRYIHVLGDEPSNRVGVEYRLNDMFSIGSSVSTTGDAGLDLILRHDF